MKSWLFMGTLVVLCGALGVLQYQWIGEVSIAAGDRLRAALDVNLARLSQDFHGEIASAFREMGPSGVEDAAQARSALEARIEQAKKSGSAGRIFRQVGLAIPRSGEASLEVIDRTSGRLQPA